MKYTLLYRIWHWMMAFSVIGLFGTVALRKTFLSWHTNAAVIQGKLAQTGVQISDESAKMIAKAIRAPMWEWHYILGLFLATSIAIRIYMIVKNKASTPIVSFIKASKDEKLQKGVYLVLCFAIAVMAISGAVLYFYKAFGFTKDGVHWVKEMHEYVMYAVLLPVLLHIAGVLRHELTTKEGIVSRMIHGDDEIK